MDLLRVEEVSSKLHLVYHRNKNQHGRSAWWRWLSMLRRTLLKLLSTTQYEGQECISEYLHAYIIPRCYVAFSTVVADGQFSTLGSVLMAALGQIWNVTSLGGKSRHYTVKNNLKTTANEAYADDIGVRITRLTEKPDMLQQPKSSKKEALFLSGHQSTVRCKKAKNKEKKSKAANAIDDIFNAIK
ncbi:hypothetical protein BGW36DRAFT_433709 [Talaromyces proteolyticus]|uniref:RNase MRP protein 1 RNA binding domain-containing protein n=1 Tax=Talaromyces proteolyticus TaxID=1131652 RepID=A0AAD4KHU5_9EURO|nr:uncharacterized protein BGW36DRAFT_433709 [Talaromyces proteolyticus]KAH8689709.1 hypothetical protein BGW36DRAFT_433709 [Talaromyces proteolyticus]